MNNYALIDAVGLLDAELLDKHMEQKERLQMKLQKGKKRAFVKWGALAACFALTFAAVILFHDKNSPEIVYQEGDMCRPATISPSTSGCYEEKITRKDIETLFGRSDFDKFGLDPENFVDADRLVGNSGILYHQSGEVHSWKRSVQHRRMKFGEPSALSVLIIP